MPRLEPLLASNLSQDHQELLDKLNDLLGFECNDWLTMAYVPPIMNAAMDFCATILEHAEGCGEHLKWLVCYACSKAYGCQYCVAHTAFAAVRFGVPDEKLANIKDFLTASCYSDAERAALSVAVGAGKCPSDISDAEFENLKLHFDESQIVKIVSLASMMGFFNRWNDVMATELERPPRQNAELKLGTTDWNLGKHDGTS